MSVLVLLLKMCAEASPCPEGVKNFPPGRRIRLGVGEFDGRTQEPESAAMKLNGLALLLLTAAIVLTGCETRHGTPNRTGTGALAGGAIGAASGAVIGGRNAGAGALIGGAVGAVTGGLIGNAMDREAQARLRQQAPQTYTRIDQGRPLSVADVKALAAARVGDDVIISQIRHTRTSFQLSSSDLIDLKNAGVSDRVVEFMINTPPPSAGTAPDQQVVVASPPPPPRVETVVVAPGPGYVWVGGEWLWNGRWVWVGGHWLAPPYPHAVWARSYWSRGPHGYHRHGGQWR